MLPHQLPLFSRFRRCSITHEQLTTQPLGQDIAVMLSTAKETAGALTEPHRVPCMGRAFQPEITVSKASALGNAALPPHLPFS